MSQSNDESQGSGAEHDSVGTHVTWSQYTSLEESPMTHASWSHQAQGNGEPPEEVSSEYTSDPAQTTNDEQPTALEASQGVPGSSAEDHEDDDDNREDEEQRAPRFATPTSDGRPIMGNGPVPPVGGYDDDNDS